MASINIASSSIPAPLVASLTSSYAASIRDRHGWQQQCIPADINRCDNTKVL